MGKLLSLLKNDGQVTTEVFVDFENAQPSTDKEKQLITFVVDKMKPSKDILNQLRQYTGCGEQIRKAISAPSKQTEDDAWRAVAPAVGKLKDFYEFSAVVDDCFIKLLRQLSASEGDVMMAVNSNLEQFQATCLQLSLLLVFALDFDDLKLTNPSIQNDFSYYRRTLARLKLSEHKDLLETVTVKDDLANRMSLFYANSTPMTKTIVDSLVNSVSSNQLQDVNVTLVISTMINICHVAVSENKFNNSETLSFCLRVMVACIVVYDYVHPKGVFHKDSEVNIKSHIKLIQNCAGPHQESLLNAIRYSTKNLNSESTPKQVKMMLSNSA